MIIDDAYSLSIALHDKLSHIIMIRSVKSRFPTPTQRQVVNLRSHLYVHSRLCFTSLGIKAFLRKKKDLHLFKFQEDSLRS